MNQTQPRRWTVSTVIGLIVLILLADHLFFNVALPAICKMAIGVVLGLSAVAGAILVIALLYWVWLVLTSKPESAVTKK